MTAPATRRGFSAEAVAELVRRRDEPDWMRQRRLDAWQTYERLPMPTRQDEEWRRTDLRDLKLDEVAPFADGHNGRTPRGTLLPEAERQNSSAASSACATATPSSIGWTTRCARRA